MATHQRPAPLGDLPILRNAAINAEEKVQVLVRDHMEQDSTDKPTIKMHEKSRPTKKRSPDLVEDYNFRIAMDSWDQIGNLAWDVSTSVLSQLAASMSEQLRGDDDRASAKRRKLNHASSTLPPSQITTEPNLVSSDDESNVGSQYEPISRDLSKQIDRMARMSKYMMQIDHYHRLLKAEMAAIVQEQEKDC